MSIYVNAHGRLSSDVTVLTGGEKVIAKFNIAVNRGGKDQGADFFPCVAFGKTAEVISNNCVKGSEVIVHGSLRQGDLYEKDGQKRRGETCIMVNTFEFCGSKPQTQNDSSNQQTETSSSLEVDEELPF